MKAFFLIVALTLFPTIHLTTSSSYENNPQAPVIASFEDNKTLGQVWIDIEYVDGLTYWVLKATNTSGVDQDLTVEIINDNSSKPVKLTYTVYASYYSKRNPQRLHSFNIPTSIVGQAWGEDSLW